MGKKFKSLKRPIKIGEADSRAPHENKRLSTDIKSIKQIEKTGEKSLEGIKIDEDVNVNTDNINAVFKDCSDVIIRRFTILGDRVVCLAVYVDGIVDKNRLNDNLFRHLMSDPSITQLHEGSDKKSLMGVIKDTTISIGELKEVYMFNEAIAGIMYGNCVLFVDGNPSALVVSTIGWQSRAVEQPTTEEVVVGPKEGFVENFRTNTSLLRKRIKTPDLKMEKHEIGRLTKTGVILTYINGVADHSTVAEVRKRLKRIDVDSIIDSGYIEQLIEDNTFSPFPQVEATERPDGVAAALSEGRIAMIVDGSPFILIVPTLFIHFLTSPEDYYQRFYFSTFIRLLRSITFFIALLAPALYVAMTTYHQEMIPTSLLVTIATARADVPFPAVIEALLMELTFEILREAGVRLPKAVGQAVSIVGALIIGEAAVQAGIVGQGMIIVVAITGIASFTIPKYTGAIAIRLLRFLFIFAAGTMGIFGIIMAGLFLLLHMAGLRSVGVPYLSPFAPVSIDGWKDTLVRMPMWFMRKRPLFINPKDKTRMKQGLQPRPPGQSN